MLSSNPGNRDLHRLHNLLFKCCFCRGLVIAVFWDAGFAFFISFFLGTPDDLLLQLLVSDYDGPLEFDCVAGSFLLNFSRLLSFVFSSVEAECSLSAEDSFWKGM